MTWLSDETVERLRAVANWPELPSERYAVMEEIGRGGMGSVYAAIDTELGREVAIKVSNGVDAPAFERRLSAESRVLARLEHPGIVPVHDVGRLADGRLFYVMKRVHGQTLSEYLRHDSDLSDRLRIFERICEAVAFAHARRILHRDLKPDNVMIGSFGEVVVMDWGVAKALDDNQQQTPQEKPSEEEAQRAGTNHGTVLGTRGFMAPEQARGDLATVDERADVYSLGAMLLALFAKDPAPVHDQSVAVKLAALTSIPRPLRSICGRALAVDHRERYPSAAELGEDVARYRAGEAVRAHRETTLERVSRVAKLYRTPIVLVLTYMVMRALIALTTGW
jgi:eukaryotic-like serine/threonine-protein kinase